MIAQEARCATAEDLDWGPRAEMIGGGLLAGLGVMRGSLPGLVLTLLGGGLFLHGMQTCQACQRRSRISNAMHEAAEYPDPLIERSRVDETSWESFPASDPPGRY